MIIAIVILLIITILILLLIIVLDLCHHAEHACPPPAAYYQSNVRNPEAENVKKHEIAENTRVKCKFQKPWNYNHIRSIFLHQYYQGQYHAKAFISTWFKPRENILPEFLLCLRSKFRITICDNNLIKYILVWRSKNIWLWLKLIFLDAGGTQKHPLSFRITHHCHIHHHHLHHLEHHFLSVVWSDDLFPPKGPSKPPHWQDPRSSPHSSPSSSTRSSHLSNLRHRCHH